MLDFVKETFIMEKQRQELLGVHCEATIDGYDHIPAGAKLY